MRTPYFQFYGDDFIAGTIEMSQAEVGAYMRLLCHQWSRGHLPADEEKLRRIAGGNVTEDVLAKFPTWDDGLRRNRRMERVRTEQQEFRDGQRRKGQASALARGYQLKSHQNGTHPQPDTQPNSNRGSTAVQPSHQPEAQPDTQPKPNLPSPSPSPSPIPPPEEGAHTQTREAEQRVELPMGFPVTLEVAVLAADTVGCTREFAATQWAQAMSRGGRDSRDVPIRRWPSYLAACRDYQANRDAERQQREKTAGPGRPDARNLAAQIRALEQEIAEHPGNPENTRGSAEAKRIQRPNFNLKCRKLTELKRRLAEGEAKV